MVYFKNTIPKRGCVMGFPERATRELGEKVCGEIVESLVNYIDILEANTK